MSISPPELVRAAMAATGKATPTELARALRMTSYTAPRNIKRWLDGLAQPDYDSTITLLRAAGMLNVDSPSPPDLTASELTDVRQQLTALDRKLDTHVVTRLDQLNDAIRDATRERA